MFTGLIRHRGKLAARDGLRLRIACPGLRESIAQGDSIAVNGVCLTAETLTADGFGASLLPETLDATTLGVLPVGSPLNLETALRAGDPLGGHWLQGHVDGTVAVLSVEQTSAGLDAESGASWRIGLELPAWLRPWLVPKGSIALDGVSLTVQKIEELRFYCAIIPETWRATNLGNIMAGAKVNVEADLLLKAVSQTLEAALERRGLASAREE